MKLTKRKTEVDLKTTTTSHMVSFMDFHLQFHTNFSNSLISHELKSLSKMDKFVTCMTFETQ